MAIRPYFAFDWLLWAGAVHGFAESKYDTSR